MVPPLRVVLGPLLVLGLVAGPVAPVAGSAHAAPVTTAPPDPPQDRLGWENGYWHNESIRVDRTDGLNETELDKVVARSMARVEFIRRLEFESQPPVEVISRETYGERISGRFENVSPRERLFHNTLAEARFFAGETENWVERLRNLQTGGVLGFYSPTEDRIVVISDDTEQPKLNEIVLAQELLHALQDQRFDHWERYINGFRNGTMTTEEHNRYDAVGEGDGTYVDFLYQQRCGDEWDCLLPENQGGLPFLSPGEFGAVVTQAVPYSDGPTLVQNIYQRGGWEAVNALYEPANAVKSTEQIIHPEKYPNDTPTTVTITDRSTDAWHRLVPPPNGSLGGLPGQNATYETFGEAGMVAMFLTASRAERRPVVIGYQRFFTGGEIDFYDYGFQPTAGWDGDRLVVYVTNDSLETGETAYVWKSVWDSPKDAREFADAYVELLEYHDAERVGQETYRIPEVAGEYADAFHVAVDGATVLIVNAPTVEALSAVRTDVEVREPTPTPSPTPTATETTAATTRTGTATTATPPTDTATPATTTVATPGFTLPIAIAALVVVAVLARRRG